MALVQDQDIDPIDPPDISPDVGSGDTERPCATCGLPLPAGAHGRTKYHAECRPTQQSTPTGRKRAGNVDIDQLVSDIAQLHATVGAGLTYLPPTQRDGMVIAGNATGLAESWRPVLIKDKAVRDFWVKATTNTGWGRIVVAYGMLCIAIAGNHGVKLPGLDMSPPQEATP